MRAASRSSAPAATLAAGDLAPGGAPARRFTAARRDASATAARLLSAAAGATCGLSAIARTLQISVTSVARWCDPEHPASMTVRDVLVAPRAFRRAVGLALVGAADTMPPPPLAAEVRGLRVSARAGAYIAELEAALADGVLTEDERAALARRLHALAIEAGRAERDLTPQEAL